MTCRRRGPPSCRWGSRCPGPGSCSGTQSRPTPWPRPPDTAPAPPRPDTRTCTCHASRLCHVLSRVTYCHAAPALVPPVEVAGAAVVLLDAAPALALQVLGQVHRHQPAVEHRRYHITRGIGSSAMPYWSWKVTVLMTRTSLSTVSDLAAWQERRWCEQQPPQRSSRVQPGHTSVWIEAVTFPVPVRAVNEPSRSFTLKNL